MLMNGTNECRKWRHKEGMGTLFTYSDVPSLPPKALEGAFGKGVTMLHIFLHLLGLIVEDIDLVKEERARGLGEGGL